MTATLHLDHFTFDELLHADGLSRLDQFFLTALKAEDPLLHDQLLAYRHQDNATSELLINCAIFLEAFLATFFHIEEAVAIAQTKTTADNPLAIFKKYYVLRRAKKDLHRETHSAPFNELNQWLEDALKHAALKTDDKELSIALLGNTYLDNPEHHKASIEKLVQWCVYALKDPAARTIVSHWTSFHIPERLDFEALIPTVTTSHGSCNRMTMPDDTLRLRDGFNLTDQRMSARSVQDEVNYCIYCHDHEGDFCSKGFPVKKGDPAQGFKKNPLDIALIGCPLEEKISEMNFLKNKGYTIASLAMIMIDNPLCPATGHRICNDCMKACIYQKQEPVNIPQIETRVLIDALNLPWGVEIYDLLTRWHPLRQKQWVMKPYNGLKILIAGMGPAGFTLAHHLLLEGFAVVGCDGLKIEPLPTRLRQQPIYQYAELEENLDERMIAGFGGVAEYGITVRWDKNFLKLIYLTLMRRPYFQVFGCVRFGGTLLVEDAWKMGFDHFVVAVGAGLPKALPIPNSLAPGMRQANDFLMALNLGGAFKKHSLSNLQVRLPAIVIGGGLTGVDTATEAAAYYIVQVENLNERYQSLLKAGLHDALHAALDLESNEILNEYLQHARAIHAERENAKREHRLPNFIQLIRLWGGVSILYRRSIQESHAYLLNHEELQKALEEGIYYLPELEPAAVQLDHYGSVSALTCKKRVKNDENDWVTTDESISLSARTILVATGTRPNTAYEFEYRNTFNRHAMQYQHYDEVEGELKEIKNAEHCKVGTFGPFTSYQKDHHRVSLIGDTHPVFHGSVVKAILSGMRTYPYIVALLKDKMHTTVVNEQIYQQFATHLTKQFSATLLDISKKTNAVLELTVQAPLAAQHYQPGQFYRLQNFETLTPKHQGAPLQMEPLILNVAACDPEKSLLTFIVTENTVSAKLCAMLKPGEPIALMGPTGVRTKIPTTHETILIIGDPSSFAFVRSCGPHLRKAGNRVLYVCQYQTENELYCRDELEQATDICIFTSIPFTQLPILLPENTLAIIDRIYIIGSPTLLRHFQAARETTLDAHLAKHPKILGSVYGNMQCMLKGVCAQCLQWQIDPATGKRTKAVFACSWQHQPIELIDMTHLETRTQQNRLTEYLNQLWLEHCYSS